MVRPGIDLAVDDEGIAALDLNELGWVEGIKRILVIVRAVVWCRASTYEHRWPRPTCRSYRG